MRHLPMFLCVLFTVSCAGGGGSDAPPVALPDGGGGETSDPGDAGGDAGGEPLDAGDGVLVWSEAPPITVTGDGTPAAHAKVVSEDALRNATFTLWAIYVPAADVDLLPDLAVGDVIASAGEGILRRITDLSWVGGDRVITTMDAPLAEAFEDGEFAMHVGFGGDDGKADAPDGGTRTWIHADLDGMTLYESEEEEIKLTIEKGTISASPDFDFNLTLNGMKMEYAEILTTGNVLIELQLKVEGKLEKDFSKTKDIPLFEKSSVVMFGFLPVKVAPFVRIQIGVEGKLEGEAEATAGSRITIPLVHRYVYDPAESDGFVYETQGKMNATAYPKMTTKGEASFEAKVYAELQLGMKIYDKLSVSIDLGPYAKAEVKSKPKCTYTLTAGVAGAFTVALEAIAGLIDEKDKDWDIVDVPKVLSSGDCKDGETGLEGVLCDTAKVVADVAEWPEGMDKCTILNGTLEIVGNTGAVDLSPLQAIEAIKGDLRIEGNSGQADLSFLSSLKIVEGDLALSSNDDLTDASALDRLERIDGTLSINSNNDLEGLPDFGLLTTLVGLSITTTPKLGSVSGFHSVTSPMGGVSFAGSDPLSTLSMLSQVPSVSNLKINVVADTVQILGGVQEAGEIEINIEATHLDALAALHGATSVIFEARGLETAQGTLSSLVKTDGPVSVKCTDCKEIPNFASLEKATSLNVEVTSEAGVTLEALPPFASLEEVEKHAAVIATGLGAASATLFPKLTAVWNGALTIELPPATTSLDGLHVLEGIAGNLNITGPGLTQVTGFGALTSVWRIFFGTPALVTAPAFDALVEYGDHVSAEYTEDDLPFHGRLPSFGVHLAAYPTMAKLKAAGFLWIQNNDVMTDFSGLTGLEQIQTIDLEGCDNLTSISGLTNLAQVGGLVSDNSYTDEVHGSLLCDTPLSDVSGLAKLQAVENDLRLEVCGGDPTALAALTSVGGQLWTCADEASYCQALEWFDGVAKGGGSMNGTPPEGGCE